MGHLSPESVDDLVVAAGKPEECRQVMKTESVAGVGFSRETTRRCRCRP